MRNPTGEQLAERVRASGELARIEQKYRVKIDPALLLGCGKDGCAWDHGDYAFKLTQSADDASATLALLELRRSGLPVEIKNGLARIFEVCKLAAGLWIIISEMLAKPTPEEVTALRQFSGSQRDLQFATPAMIVSLLSEKTLPNAKQELAARYGEGRIPDETIERAYRAWRAIALLVRDYNVMLYQDAHAGNFGRDEAGHLKLFDFGSSSFPERKHEPEACNWSCPTVAQNPDYGRAWESYATPGGGKRKLYKPDDSPLDLGNEMPRKWPPRVPLPKKGDIVWHHIPRGPTMPVAVYDVDKGGFGYWVHPIGKLYGSSKAVFVGIEELSPPTRSEMRQLVAAEGIIQRQAKEQAREAQMKVKAKATPPSRDFEVRNGDFLWHHEKDGSVQPVRIELVEGFGLWYRGLGDKGKKAKWGKHPGEFSLPTVSELKKIMAIEAGGPPTLGPLVPKPKAARVLGRTEKWIKGAQEEGHDWVKTVAEKGWIRKIENAAGIKLDGMFGCGAFGCAFGITHPPDMAGEYVCKITADQSEGPAQAYIQAGQKRGPKWTMLGPVQKTIFGAKERIRHPVGEWFREGYTVVHKVMTLSETFHFGLGGAREFGTQDRKVYAIIREDIDPEWEDAFPGEAVMLQNALLRYRDYARQFNRAKEMKFGVAEQARHLRSAERYAQIVEKISPSIAAGLMAWYVATGKLQQDVHGGNIGLRKHAKFGRVGDLVIFDPGMSASKKADLAAKKGVEVIKNNPCPSVML